MDEQPRIVVTLPGEDAPVEAAHTERMVVTMPGTLTVAFDAPDHPDSALAIDLSAPGSGRSRRVRTIAAAGAVLLLLAGLGTWFFVARSSTPVNPATVALPTHPAQAAATKAYLTGTNARLISLIEDAASLESQETKPTCLSLATRILDPLGSPAQLLTAAEGIPNMTMRAAVLNELNAFAHYLSSCEQSQNLTAPRTQLKFSTVVAQRLLAELHISAIKGIPA